jgi:hypothetical protein
MRRVLTQPDLFQADRPTPFDVVVTFDKALPMLEAMKTAGITPRTMDRMKGQYRLRGYAPAGLLARLIQGVNSSSARPIKAPWPPLPAP